MNMKQIIQTIMISLVFLSAYVNAHPGDHEQPETIQKEQAVTTATNQIKQLVEDGELDVSWETINASDAVLVRRDSRMKWIISFVNPSQEKENSTLYIYLTNTGNYLSTNFTGE
ncbi:MAG: hypothetical protein ACJA2O_003209 [Candidatus Azotimanducaceae bacterium]|jgi:hypothetical protein